MIRTLSTAATPQLLARVAAAGLSVLYGLSFVAKLVAYNDFLGILANSRLVPGGLEAILAPCLLCAELLIAVALWVHPLRRWASGTSLALGGLFLGYHLWAYRMGLSPTCSCLGWFLRISPEGGVALAMSILLASAVAHELGNDRR